MEENKNKNYINGRQNEAETEKKIGKKEKK